MGYAHYFSYNLSDPEFDRAWPVIVEDSLRIMAHVEAAAGIRLASARGISHPSYAGIDLFALEGDPDDHEQTSETLALFRQLPPGHWRPLQDGWLSSMVKTGRLPYDLAVTAILLRCKMLLPDAFALHSDGGWDKEWLYGATGPMPGGLGPRAVVAELFGDAPADSPFEREKALLISR